MKSINKKIIISGIRYVSPLLLLLVVFFSCSIAFADSFESSVGVAFTLNPTVTISITGGTGATNDGLTIANLTPGDVKDSNIITVSATANTPLGYTLGSTVGNSTYNSTELRKDGTSTTNKFTNLTANISSLSNFSDNTWGYSYSTDSGSTWISGDITSTTNTGYNGLPIYTTSSPIKLINSNTAGSSSIQFKIGAKASSTQIAGTYNNIINFIGTGKIVTTEYTINYNDPSGEATSMPSQQQGTESVGTGAVAISSTQPTRSGYLFKGWCTSQVADDADCPTNDTLIQPGGLLALDPGTSSATATVTKNLYAIWKSNMETVTFDDAFAAAGKTKQGNYYKMQDGTSSICAAVTSGQTGTLIDARDGNTYNVAKLADDNCWMLENLRLDLVDSTVQGNLTSDTTNAEDSSLAYLKGTATYRDPISDPNGKYPTAALGYGGSSNYYSVPKISVSGTCYDAYCVDSPASGQWNSEVVTPQTINGVTSIAQGKVGVYYNYCAISAGTYCYGYGTSGTGSPTSDPDPSSLQDVKEDICPKGWRLPTSTADGEFQALYTAYSSNDTDFQTALDTPLSGYFYSGTARSQGSSSYFWSSTWYTTNSMRILYVNPYQVNPSNNSNRYSGNSARCILGS